MTRRKVDPAQGMGFFRALREQGPVRLFFHPVSCLAWIVHATDPAHSGSSRGNVSKQASEDLAEVRYFAMAFSFLWFVVGAIPLAAGNGLPAPYRLIVTIAGSIVVLVPAGATLTAHLAGAFARPKRLLLRVAEGDLGRQLDAAVWGISTVGGIALGTWLTTL